MKIVTERPCFQGEIMFRRVSVIPDRAKRVVSEHGQHILAHSETGHHHVIESRAADRFIDETNSFIAWIEVMEPTELKHLRDFDTHESWMFEPGQYEIVTQREAIPEGWRRAAD